MTTGTALLDMTRESMRIPMQLDAAAFQRLGESLSSAPLPETFGELEVLAQ
jgi:hypothetical protein